MKNKFVLEHHSYAPELNKIHFKNGVTMPAPGMYSIRDVKNFYFAPLVRTGRYVKVRYINLGYPFLNKQYQGFVKSYSDINRFLRGLKKRHNVGGGEFKISIKWIGDNV